MLKSLATNLITTRNGNLFLVMAAITVLAALLRILFISEDSFWHDEILSVQRAQMNDEDFGNLLQGFPNMAFYYWLLHHWIALGDSEITVRMLSVVASVGTVLVIYFLGTRLFGPQVGIISAALLAINAFHIQYAQEARSYSVVVLLLALSSLFLVRSIQRPYWGNWMVYAVLTILSVFTHYFGALVLLAHGASLLFLPRQVIPWKRLMVSASVIAIALIMPLSSFASLAFADSEGATQVGWVPGASMNSVYRWALDMTGNGGNCAGRVCGTSIDTSDFIYFIYFIPVLAAAAIGIRKWFVDKGSFESWKFALLLTWLLVPVIITLLGSFVAINAFVSRYLIVSLPPLVILAAVGISELRGLLGLRVALVSAVMLVALEAISVSGVYAYYTEFQKEDWRGIANAIASQWQPGDGMLFYMPWIEDDVEEYLRLLEITDAEIDSIVPEKSWARFVHTPEAGDQDAIAEYLPDKPQRVWLILAHNRKPADRAVMTNEIQEALSNKYRNVHSTQLFRVSVVLYSDPVPGVFGGRWHEIVRADASCFDVEATMVGSYGDDTLVGTPGDDVIHGLDGDDTIHGRGGNDIICGGPGSDTIYGEDGNDRVHGGEENDLMSGGPGDDDLSGTKGDDQLLGDGGNDILSGGTGLDSLDGGEGDDTLNGNNDDDVLNGGVGNDTLGGGKDDDVIDGGPGANSCKQSRQDSMVNCE
jgi:uncharacterized membrane protein